MTNLTKRFELNGKAYRTDAETLAVLNSIVPSANASGDPSAVAALMLAGLKTGRIVEQAAARIEAKQEGMGYCCDIIMNRLMVEPGDGEYAEGLIRARAIVCDVWRELIDDWDRKAVQAMRRPSAA